MNPRRCGHFSIAFWMQTVVISSSETTVCIQNAVEEEGVGQEGSRRRPARPRSER